jgi:hypothetical protein
VRVYTLVCVCTRSAVWFCELFSLSSCRDSPLPSVCCDCFCHNRTVLCSENRVFGPWFVFCVMDKAVVTTLLVYCAIWPSFFPRSLNAPWLGVSRCTRPRRSCVDVSPCRKSSHTLGTHYFCMSTAMVRWLVSSGAESPWCVHEIKCAVHTH